ncbi:hypothetical protein B0T16DRAFT_338623 [Cercophora newfieldiana]|uniref:GST N-terminal domain-containing protein n=1 Tax=Cercophora newfieldiana TaxID=92897 RepID=A0AA40CHS6_9PEZI|nr:hypothetical protein B0T16DRAFT_338623 [Cercophora newfieldiana]
MSSPVPPPIVLYHYPFSPYARRIVWYLRLRGISYLQCLQPPILPRPDISLLGLKYRRIPILSIGRDIYLDTRLILPKLESLVPGPPLSAPPGSPSLALQSLLSLWTTSSPGGLFAHAMNLLPGADLPLLRDPAFQRDRADFVGGGGARVSREESMGAIRDAVALLEGTVLADGREWVLGGEGGPSLGDIEAVWVVHWLTGLKGALDERVVSGEKFPRVYAWLGRFQRAVEEAKGRVEVRTVEGEEARGVISGAERVEGGCGGVDGEEPVVRKYGLREGDLVEVWPVDTGSAHVDVGRLVGLSAVEVVFETDKGFRVHAPRDGFRVKPVKRAEASL